MNRGQTADKCESPSAFQSLSVGRTHAENRNLAEFRHARLLSALRWGDYSPQPMPARIRKCGLFEQAAGLQTVRAHVEYG
jgi:hypothetical protein